MCTLCGKAFTFKQKVSTVLYIHYTPAIDFHLSLPDVKNETLRYSLCTNEMVQYFHGTVYHT